MADTTTNKQPLIGGDSENFMRLMNRALTVLNKLIEPLLKPMKVLIIMLRVR